MGFVNVNECSFDRSLILFSCIHESVFVLIDDCPNRVLERRLKSTGFGVSQTNSTVVNCKHDYNP